MADECYRLTTLGRTLKESLQELLNGGRLPAALVDATMEHFDRCMAQAVRHQSKLTLTVKSGGLHTYRLSENVCTFLLTDVEFWQAGSNKEVVRAPVTKIIAWEADRTEKCDKHKRLRKDQ